MLIATAAAMPTLSPLSPSSALPTALPSAFAEASVCAVARSVTAPSAVIVMLSAKCALDFDCTMFTATAAATETLELEPLPSDVLASDWGAPPAPAPPFAAAWLLAFVRCASVFWLTSVLSSSSFGAP